MGPGSTMTTCWSGPESCNQFRQCPPPEIGLVSAGDRRAHSAVSLVGWWRWSKSLYSMSRTITGQRALRAPRPCPLSVLSFLSARYRGERGDQTSQIGWEGEEIIIFGGTSDWDAWVTLVSVVS